MQRMNTNVLALGAAFVAGGAGALVGHAWRAREKAKEWDKLAKKIQILFE